MHPKNGRCQVRVRKKISPAKLTHSQDSNVQSLQLVMCISNVMLHMLSVVQTHALSGSNLTVPRGSEHTLDQTIIIS